MTKDPVDPVARFWDAESRAWGQKYGNKTSYFYRRRTFNRFFARTGLQRASILDYGCGSGDVTLPMIQMGHKVVGVDIAEAMVNIAKERAKQLGLSERADYQQVSDATNARIVATRFDVVVCSSVLEYVERDDALIQMFHDVLVDRGYLLVSVPDRSSVFCRLDRWMHANRSRMPRIVPVQKLGYLDIQQRQYDIEHFIAGMRAKGFVLRAKKHNSITLQRGYLMERLSNIPGVGMLALMMFQKCGATGT